MNDTLRVNKKLMEAGVIIPHPEAVYVGPEVTVGVGSTLYPGTTLDGSTAIGENCIIGPNTLITSSTISSGASILFSVVKESAIHCGASVGPFAYIRPHSVIGENVKIGDFVEVKNSVIGDGTKISHLAYVGDSDVGCRVNFGCGAVTVNYDGANKSRTTIKDGAFIGCNTNLVAPVTIHENAYTAAGSTITNDVPESALAIARQRQINKENWNKDRGGSAPATPARGTAP